MEQGVMSDRTLLRYWMPTEFSESDWTNVQARIYEIIKHWFWASPDEMRKLVFGIGPVSYTHLTLPTICSV